MRLKISFSNIIAIAALGALAVMAATDPRFRELLIGNWRWLGLLLAIVVLVMAQVIMVRRRLYVLPAGRTNLAEPTTPRAVQPTSQPPTHHAPQDAAAAAGDVEKPAGDPASGPAKDPTDGEDGKDGRDGKDKPGPDLDGNLFTRFQHHLESAEKQDAQAPAPNTAPASEEDVVDRVELSPASRRKAPRRGAARKTTSGVEEDEQDGPDLFSDLRPQPVTPPAGDDASGNGKQPAGKTTTTALSYSPTGLRENFRSGETATEKNTEKNTEKSTEKNAEKNAATDATGTSVADSREGRGLEGRTPPPGVAPFPEEPPQPPPDEVTDALSARAGDSAEKGRAELAEEAAALLNLAEEAARNGVWERLRASLENYLDHLADAPDLVDWRARRLQVRLTVHDQQAGPALQAFEEMLSAGYRPGVDDVPGLLEELLQDGERKLTDTLRVSMLVRILAAFRQNRDQGAMDSAYTWIEAAQERAGDEKRLLQYLKNHLEIRKAMGNVPGQLELIDQIGNRCFKLGLTEEAKTYYEMGLKLRGESEDEAPTGDGGSAVG